MGTPLSFRRASSSPVPTRTDGLRAAFAGLILALCLACVLFVGQVLRSPHLLVGNVASSTVLAPRGLSVVDQAATQTARRHAAAQVPTQYRTDLRPEQQAAAKASTLLHSAAVLRRTVQPGSALQDAAQVLARASEGAVSPDQATALLKLGPAHVSVVASLVVHALTAVEQEPVYAAQLPLLRLVPPFPGSAPAGPERAIASQLFATFLRPNRIVDATLTTRARHAAASAVPPVRDTYRQGQVIVRAGDVVTAQAEAALVAAGLQRPLVGWQPLIAAILIALVVAAGLHGYLLSVQSPILAHPRQVLLLDALFLLALVVASFVLPSRDLLPFLFPAAALSMSLSVLLSCELSMVASVTWAVLAGWFLAGSYEMTTYYLVTGLTGALLAQRVRSSSQLFMAGLAVSSIGLITLLAFRLQGQSEDWLGFGTYAAAALVSGGLAAALTLGSFSPLARLFGVTTSLHLLEISHPNHPLLRRLMVEAPGTYHHSIMIGTLAERAAEQIGADPLLVRVCAYFHDIGKLTHPGNFTENQAGTANVHDQLEPAESVRLIHAHVRDGLALARHFHLPQVIEDGIQQHHGTTLVAYFYHQAVAMYGEDHVNPDEFRYPGPRPQTRETAILMLADGVEAAVRSAPGIDADQIRAIIHRIVQERLHDGQLDESALTLRDIALIEDSFGIVLQGLSHPRIQYPAPVRAAANE